MSSPGSVSKEALRVTEDNFFRIIQLTETLPAGGHFKVLFERAAAHSEPEQVLHLCFIDRLAYILQSQHAEQFVKDIHSVRLEETPVLFQRSTAAWATHPRNYREIERFATTAGELLYGRALDFAWSHLAIRAKQLKEILRHVYNPDMSMLAEMILQIKDRVRTVEVDWLEWEDPFILRREAAQLKRERESSPEETRKRLAYVLPMVKVMADSSKLAR